MGRVSHRVLRLAVLIFAIATGGLLLPTVASAQDEHSKNPLATGDELTVEHLAERLAAAPQVQAAAAATEQQWRAKLTAKLGSLDAQSDRLLEPAIDELIYAYAQKAANNDPARPKVSWIESPPHRWFDERVAGGRYAGDNPDTIYRIVPIDGVSSYTITGRYTPNRPVTTLFQAVTEVNVLPTVAQLDGRDLVTRPDGTFTITINPTASPGQANHLQTTPAVVQLFIRDTLGDWNHETPPTLTVHRTGGPPVSPPKTFRQLIAETIKGLNTQDWINFYITGIQFGPPPNVLPPPLTGLIDRSFGNFHLADNRALVITAQPGGAAYLGLALQNVWTITPAYWNHQTSLTNRQAVPNADGTYTFIISARDPGVYNWIDTTGLDDGTLLMRWQGLPHTPSPSVPSVSARLIDLTHLDSVLPPGTRRVSPNQRATQLAQRRAGFNRRIATGSALDTQDP